MGGLPEVDGVALVEDEVRGALAPVRAGLDAGRDLRLTGRSPVGRAAAAFVATRERAAAEERRRREQRRERESIPPA